VVDLLAARHGSPLRKGRDRALVAETRIDGRRVVLAFPQTFVNLSGEAAGRLVKRCGLGDDLSRLIVVHDELDLPAGRVKVKEGGGIAGHNGLGSLKAHLHSAAFTRVRIGIGRPPGRQDPADFVLRRPGKAEQIELDVAVEEAAEAVEMILAQGSAAAMNHYNTARQ
jgi:PTH1 family peptidyl-tRNA hydrolase